MSSTFYGDVVDDLGSTIDKIPYVNTEGFYLKVLRMYTSMISNGISYIPDSADSCLLVVTVSSSRNICDEATCDYELV